MYGLNKQKLSEQQINHALHIVYGCKAVNIQELPDGWANSAYELSMEDGASYIMKVSPPTSTQLMRYEYELMKTEVEVLYLLSQVDQIPVPKVIAFDRSRTLLDGEFFIMEKLEGEPYNKLKESMTEQERSSVESELGRYARLMHDIKGTGFGPYCAPMDETMSWREVFLILLNSVLDDGEEAGLPLPIAYQELRDILNSHSVCMSDVTTPSLIHWDLWDGNLFVKDGKITGIIDFERALWADPLMEHYFSNTTLDAASFVQGYGKYEQLSPNEQKRVLYYKLCLDLIMYVECHYRGYTDERHLSWAKSNIEQGIASFLQQIKLAE